MAISEYVNGTEAVTTTEWSLTTDTSGPDVDTTSGIFQCFLDLNAVALGDTFEFRVYEKVGATQRVVLIQTFSNAQGTDSAIWVSPSLILLTGWDMTLLKTAGTDRTILWSIRRIN